MALKFAISLIVLIPTLISFFLFGMVRLILVEPVLLVGKLQTPIIIVCVVSGIFLLFPLLICAGVVLFKRKDRKGEGASHESNGATSQ